MAAMDSQHLELDLHLLELRFAASRLVEPRAVDRSFLALWWLFPVAPARAANTWCSSTVIGVSPLCVALVATRPASSNGGVT